ADREPSAAARPDELLVCVDPCRDIGPAADADRGGPRIRRRGETARQRQVRGSGRATACPDVVCPNRAQSPDVIVTDTRSELRGGRARAEDAARPAPPAAATAGITTTTAVAAAAAAGRVRERIRRGCRVGTSDSTDACNVRRLGVVIRLRDLGRILELV